MTKGILKERKRAIACKIDVRAARESDVPGMVSLLALLFAQEVEFEPDLEVQMRGLRTILDDPAVGQLLVADDGQRILGMVNLLYTYSTALGARVALLEDMVVAEEARGSGLGKRLLEAAVAHCGKAGCKRITLLTDGDNARAHAFYQHSKFIRSDMVAFRRAL